MEFQAATLETKELENVLDLFDNSVIEQVSLKTPRKCAKTAAKTTDRSLQFWQPSILQVAFAH